MRGVHSGANQPTIKGPLAELLQAAREKRERAASERAQRIPARTRAPRTTSRTYFLSELEICGDARTAARTSGCSMDEIRAWRRSDPMFERDYVLALASHLKALKRMVQEIAELHQSAQVRQAAQQLLATESRHIGPDGRLDARSWRDSLASFAHSLGMDLAWWEPGEQRRELAGVAQAGEGSAA
ncbi:MAG TPA: hypothetical protein VK009_13840 [Chloroflexota bacterium]|nr:hypothetical protein [Chloroflexota bacterium]